MLKTILEFFIGKRPKDEEGELKPTVLMKKLYEWVMSIKEENIILNRNWSPDEVSYLISDKTDEEKRVVQIQRTREYEGKKYENAVIRYSLVRCQKGDEVMDTFGLIQENFNCDNKVLLREMMIRCSELYHSTEEGKKAQKEREELIHNYENFSNNF